METYDLSLKKNFSQNSFKLHLSVGGFKTGKETIHLKDINP